MPEPLLAATSDCKVSPQANAQNACSIDKDIRENARNGDMQAAVTTSTIIFVMQKSCTDNLYILSSHKQLIHLNQTITTLETCSTQVKPDITTGNLGTVPSNWCLNITKNGLYAYIWVKANQLESECTVVARCDCKAFYSSQADH